MKLEELLADNIDKWRAMVTELGGQWVGVQQGFQDVEPFVLFVAPHSMSPIGVPVSQMTLDNVKQKLELRAKSVSKKTHSDLKARLSQIAAILRDIADQIDEEIQHAEK